jgi:curli biogenesis system outer membrane secretion channel CsgG
VNKCFGHVAATVLSAALAACAQTSTGSGGSMATGSAAMDTQPQALAPQLTRCAVPLGTVALVEEQIPALAQAGLTSPTPVLRLIIAQSNCFNVVDRGEALTRIQEEQQLTGSGGSKRTLVAAQYFLTPNIIFKDQNAGGAGGALGALGSLLPGNLGLLGNAVGFQASEAESVLFLTQTSTGMQIAVAQGSAATRDWTFAGLGGGGGVGGALGAYSSTNIGKTTVAALLDAYSKLVAQVQTATRI